MLTVTQALSTFRPDLLTLGTPQHTSCSGQSDMARQNLCFQEALQMCRSVTVTKGFQQHFLMPRILNPAIFHSNLHKNSSTNGSFIEKYKVRILKAKNSPFHKYSLSIYYILGTNLKAAHRINTKYKNTSVAVLKVLILYSHILRITNCKL